MDIRLRKANLKDGKFLFRLRNERTVRLASFNNSLIDLKAHQRWFKEKLAGDGSILFVAEENSRPIAQVRFDWLSDHNAEVSIAVIKGFRGQGYGSVILRESAIQFLEEFPECFRIYAYIKSDNYASRRSFAKAGYVFQSSMKYKDHNCVEMIFFSRHY